MRFLLLIPLLACSNQGAEDSGSPGVCDTAPPVNYINFGEGFLMENCQGCHASTAPNRYGATEGVIFDTVEDAWIWRDRILARALDETNPMPPAGGVSVDNLDRLQWWLDCAEEGI